MILVKPSFEILEILEIMGWDKGILRSISWNIFGVLL